MTVKLFNGSVPYLMPLTGVINHEIVGVESFHSDVRCAWDHFRSPLMIDGGVNMTSINYIDQDVQILLYSQIYTRT